MVKRTREAAHSGDGVQKPAGRKQASDEGQTGHMRRGKEPSVNERQRNREAVSPSRRVRRSGRRGGKEDCEDKEDPIEVGSGEEGPQAGSGEAEERAGRRRRSASRDRSKRRRKPARRKKKEGPGVLSVFDKAVLRTISKKLPGKKSISADALFALDSIMNDFLDNIMKKAQLLTHYRGGNKKDNYVCAVDDIERAICLHLSPPFAAFFIKKGVAAVARAREAKLERRKREEDFIRQGIDGEELALVLQSNERNPRFEPDVSSNDDNVTLSESPSETDSNTSSSSEALPLLTYRPRALGGVAPLTNGKARARHSAPNANQNPAPLAPAPPLNSNVPAPAPDARPLRVAADNLPVIYHPKRPMMERRSSASSDQSNNRIGGLDERQSGRSGGIEVGLNEQKREGNKGSTLRRRKQEEANDRSPHPSGPKSRASASSKEKGRPMEANERTKRSGKSGV